VKIFEVTICDLKLGWLQ